MQCCVCETPFLSAPGIGWYCPQLECDWHDVFDAKKKQIVDEYEKMRRKRDGLAYAGMPKAAWLKMLEKCQLDCERAENLWRAIRV